jgi:hypothetical protein
LPEEARRATLEQFDQAMNAALRINTHQQVNMIWHDFQFFHLGLVLLASLSQHLFQTCFNWPNQHFPPLFGTPDHMLVATIKYVAIALVRFAH